MAKDRNDIMEELHADSESTLVELGPDDSAFVLRADGSAELFLENLDDDAEASEEVLLMAGLSIAFVHHRDDLRAFVEQLIESEAVSEMPHSLTQ